MGDGDPHQSRGIPDAKFVHHVMSMGLDRTHRNKQTLSNLCGRGFVNDQLEDLLFPPGEGGHKLGGAFLLDQLALHTGQQSLRQIIAEKGASAVHFTDALFEFLLTAVFE